MEHTDTHTRIALALASICVVVVGALAVLSGTAQSDTERCTGRTEYDNTERYLSTDQIANRYDVPGQFEGSGADYFRRSYRACWTDNRVWVAYSNTSGLSSHWDVR